MKFVEDPFSDVLRLCCVSEISGGQDAAEAIVLLQGRNVFRLPNINDAGQQSMWNSIKRTALVVGLLTATAAFAHAQSSGMGGSNGSSAGVGAGTSGTTGTAGTTTGTGGSTLGTGGTGSMGGGTSGTRTTGSGTAGSGAGTTGTGTGGTGTMGGSGGTGGSVASGSR